MLFAEDSTKCPRGRKKMTCYFTRPASRWFDARNKCAAEEADLAVLTRDVCRHMSRKWNKNEAQYQLEPGKEYYIGLTNVRIIWNTTGHVVSSWHFL